MCHSVGRLTGSDTTETAAHEYLVRHKLTGRLVPARLPKVDAYLQLLTSPVWEIQVVDRAGSGTNRLTQDVRASSHIMDIWLKGLCLIFGNLCPAAESDV